MKKLVIAAFAIATAIAANAATVTWNATATGTTLPGGATANGVVAYLFEGALNVDTIKAALNGGTWNPTAESGYLYTKNTSSAGAILQTGIGSYQNETVSFSMVLFDTATIGAQGNFKYAEVNNVVFSTANKTLAFATPLQAADWVAYGAIPEPTSGLMMLLGMGVLALRRRRA